MLVAQPDEFAAERGSDDAARFGFRLIGNDNQIELREEAAEIVDEPVLDLLRHRCGRDEVDARQVFLAVDGVDELRIGESWNRRLLHQQLGRDVPVAQRARQFEAEAVVADDAENGDGAGAEIDEIVRDRAGGAGGGDGAHHGNACETGFPGGLAEPGVVGTPAVEAEIADDEHRELGELRQNLADGHGSSLHKAGNVARCGPQKYSLSPPSATVRTRIVLCGRK